MGWIGVDLDGTLAIYNKDSNGVIGKPITAMMDKVKTWINDGVEVRIFTARAGDPNEVVKVQAWLIENGLDGLTITNIKDSGMIAHFDDKAIRVVHNSGEICSGCQGVISLSATKRTFSQALGNNPYKYFAAGSDRNLYWY